MVRTYAGLGIFIAQRQILDSPENCHAAVTFTGYEIVKKIRSVVHHFGTVKLFKAYLELSDPATFAKSLTIRSELQSSGVSLTDCPHNGRKDVADKMMLGATLLQTIAKNMSSHDNH
ncbi:hypothetical protein H0H81_010801 [Sphagnurus paluster]|uniref:Uncharacterized protein n=1 Tax=Sphagnurus paluster TaxID=117069 RepID=A0A9P7K7X7_9AGAR|nr:hypothetical protein H0H81_010801 [Sphagnurus paluster]